METVHKIIIIAWIAIVAVIAFQVTQAKAETETENETWVQVWIEYDHDCTTKIIDGGNAGFCFIPTEVWEYQFSSREECHRSTNLAIIETLQKTAGLNHSNYVVGCFPIALAYGIVENAREYKRESSY